jgi:hypothetical protein
MTNADPLAVTRAIRAHYLAQPGKTEAGWALVSQNPGLYNHTWRHMLNRRCGQQGLKVGPWPPPLDLRHLLPPKESTLCPY